MDAAKYGKLRKNLPLLHEDVTVYSSIIAYMIESCFDVGYDIQHVIRIIIHDATEKYIHGALDNDSRRELSSIPSDKERIDRLLQLMKHAPPDKNTYEVFLAALRSESPHYADIADRIEGTDTACDSSIKSIVDRSHYKEKLNEVLLKNFANLPTEETSIGEIRRVLIDNDVFTVNKEWSNAEIANYVCNEAFVGVEKIKRKTGLKTKTLFLKNIGKIEPGDQAASTSQPQPITKTQDEETPVDVSTLQPVKLKRFLSQEFEKNNLSKDPLDELESQDINGAIFMTLSEADMKELMPSSSFGQRRALKLVIDDHKKLKALGDADLPFQKLRDFDAGKNSTCSYEQGRLVDTNINSRGKKGTTIRNFHLPEFVSKSDVKNYVLQQCAFFAAACMNEKRNGTIYFGVSPDDSRGRSKGEIVGLRQPLADLDDHIPFLFFPDPVSQALVKTCVRNFKIMSIVSKERSKSLYVLELDVAGSVSGSDEYIRVNAKESPGFSKIKKTLNPIFIFENGKPKKLPCESSGSSRIPQGVLDQQRIECKKAPQATPCLIHLQNHLTGGLDKMDDELFIVLLLGPICGVEVDVNSMEFIKNLQPVVVFDFDPNNESSHGIYNSLEEKEEVMRVVTLDDFDERQRGHKEYQSFQSELAMCDYTNWVFCNGYGQMEQMEAIDWNKKRSRSFQAAFTHYIERCQQDRVLIIVCLFSQEYKVLLDPCDVILRLFQEQWILLAETQSIAEDWQDTFRKREKVDAKDLKERCIIGLSWEQINNGITDWCGKTSYKNCKIPDSAGCLIKVEIKKLKEWSDVEVLSALDPVGTDEDEDTIEILKKQAEEEFYRGGQVRWLNFFYDHVCRRKSHEKLQSIVEKALEGKQSEDDEKILTTYLFHEPGAGGSTLVRHVLWSLKNTYRCCIIREINNPNQVADQLTEIFLFRDKSPKPLLVLLDDEDEDKIYQLRVCLEKRARDYDDHFSNVFCCLLICSRMVGVPISERRCSMVALGQLLDNTDLNWFQQRYKDLKTRYDNPKSLIAFNILKENFNKNYIQTTVKEFLDEIKDPTEEKILKIVSCINNFDIDFKFVHASCFDAILELPPVFGSAPGGKRKTFWEANTSQSLKVFLNLSSQYDTRRVKKIRLFTKLTAEHILNCLREKTGENVSDILYPLLTHKIFTATDQEMKRFQNIISNVVKKRVLRKSYFGNENMSPVFRKDKFSPLILHIMDNENSDVAGEVMEMLFQLNFDPFTAQQIARFYIECKNYKKAEHFAEQATQCLPWNSYMWDTYAQVFKYQLYDKFQSKCQIVDGQFTQADLKDIIALCQTCTRHFRKEQLVSEKEALTSNAELNRAGYFGELRSILFVLSCLEKCSCFQSKEIVHKFLVDKSYSNSQLSFLSDEERDFLKELWIYSRNTVKKLGDEFLQTKVEIEANPLSFSHEESRRTLLQLHVSLNEYFGENSDVVPSYLHESEKCLYRSRLLFSKRCSSLFNALQLKHNNDLDVLDQCCCLVLENVRSLTSTVEDIKILLDIITVLLTERDAKLPLNLKFDDIISWSKEFYQRALKEDCKSLECFLYFCLYNFPTEERLEKFENLANSHDFDVVTKRWIEFFNATKNLERITRRETTLFFLGNGEPPHDIVYQKHLNKLMQGKELSLKWQSPEMCQQLRLMRGILSEKGDYINYSYKSKQGNIQWIKIKTANRIKNRAWFQKNVYFYLGFSFSGLKTYGMTITDPMTQAPVPGGSPGARRNGSFSNGAAKIKQAKQKLPVQSLKELQHLRSKISREIKRKQPQGKPCQDLERDLQEIEGNISKILGVSDMSEC